MEEDALYMQVSTGRVDTYASGLDEIDDSSLDDGETRDDKMQDDIREGEFIEVVEREDGSYEDI